MHRLPSLSTPELRLSAGVCYSVVAVQLDRSIYPSCHVVSYHCFVLLLASWYSPTTFDHAMHFSMMSCTVHHKRLKCLASFERLAHVPCTTCNHSSV